MEAPSLRAEAPGATYGADTATPLSRAPIAGWHRSLLRVLRVGADDGTETRLMIFLGTLLDGLAVLGAVTAEGWRWCLSTPASIRSGERLTRTVRVVVATGEEIERLNQVRPWFAGHNVLIWLADQEPDTVYDRAPDLMSWARVVLDLRAPDVDWPAARNVLLNRAIARVASLADNLRQVSQAIKEAGRQTAETGNGGVGLEGRQYPGLQRLRVIASDLKKSLVVNEKTLLILQNVSDPQLAEAIKMLIGRLREDFDKLGSVVDDSQGSIHASDEAASLVESAAVNMSNVLDFLVLRKWWIEL